MEEIKRINIVMVCSNQRAGFTQCNPYAMNVDWESRNCYNCKTFGYLARNCRNRGTEGRIGQGRRLEYGSNKNNGQENLNEEWDLILLN